MGERQQGRIKIEPGPWSKAIADDFSKRIENESHQTRDKISKATGISGSRVTQLLRADRAWYIEDIEKFCAVFNLDVPTYVNEIQLRLEGVTAPPPAWPPHQKGGGSK